jgi:hypothetical protein
MVESAQRNLAAGRAEETRQGLLLGEIINGNTRITGFVPVGDLDSGLVEASRSAGSSGVGFYRCRPGNTLQLNLEETSAARKHCQRAGAIVLLLQPREDGHPEATFFFFERNLLCGGYLHFPFDAAFLSERELRSAPPDNARALPAPVPMPQPTRPAARSSDSIRRLAVGLLAVAAIGAGAALTRAYRLSAGVRPSPPIADGAERVIELHAERQGSDLKLTWDKIAAPPESTGMLSITDGPTHRLLPLEPAQLRFGNVVYAAATQEVRVDLTVSHGNRVDARGSVVVLLGAGTTPRVVQRDIPAAPGPQASVQSRQPEPPEEKHPATRPFVPNPVAKDGNIDFSPPPTVSAAHPVPAEAALRVPAVELARDFPPTAAPATPNLPLRDIYVEPVAIFRSSPTQPPELKAVLGRETKVLVKVQIDEKGRVTKADPVLEKGVHQLVAGAAVRAAFNWRFAPARIGDRPVKSEVTLEFRFVRK